MLPGHEPLEVVPRYLPVRIPHPPGQLVAELLEGKFGVRPERPRQAVIVADVFGRDERAGAEEVEPDTLLGGHHVNNLGRQKRAAGAVTWVVSLYPPCTLL